MDNQQNVDVLFIKKSIEKLTCPADRKEIRYGDPQTRALFITVARGGTKSFVYRRKTGGITRQRFIGYFPETKIEQARAKASELNAAFGRGDNPFEGAAESKRERTLRELFTEYLNRHARKSRKTADDMERNFERWFAPLANRKASDISHIDAERLMGDIAESRGPYSANRAVQLARAVYNKAKASFRIYFGDNPFAGITLFPEKPRHRFLTNEEAGKLIKALYENATNCDLRDFVLLDMLTGARKANLLAMRWQDVNLQNGTWTIPLTKNGTSQVVPLGGNEIAILQSRLNAQVDETDPKKKLHVFPGTGKSGHLTDLKHSWTTLRKRLELQDVTIHDLRRSLAATMASANVNVALIKSALHHSDLKTTLGVYARTNKSAELEARELAHSVWFREAGLLPEQDNVKPMRQIEQGSRSPIGW